MAKLMRVNRVEAGRFSTPIEHLANPVAGEVAAPTEPEPFEAGMDVAAAHSQIAIEAAGFGIIEVYAQLELIREP